MGGWGEECRGWDGLNTLVNCVYSMYNLIILLFNIICLGILILKPKIAYKWRNVSFHKHFNIFSICIAK
jgi:hypothetical protein